MVDVAVSAFDRLGQTEVQHLDLAVGREADVGGLEVTVHYAILVRYFERLGHLGGHARCLVDRHGSAREPGGEVLSLDQFHGQKVHAFVLGKIVERGDVGMIERGKEARLSFETCHALPVGSELLGEDFDGDSASQAYVARAIHLAHAADADPRFDFVVAESLPDHRGFQYLLRMRRRPGFVPGRRWENDLDDTRILSGAKDKPWFSS